MDPRGHSTPFGPDRHQGFVDVLNESWPPADVARRLGDRPPEEWVDVRVRVEFVTGEEWLSGQARRWWGRHVRVNCDDRRLPTWAVWVDANDVQRIQD